MKMVMFNSTSKLLMITTVILFLIQYQRSLAFDNDHDLSWPEQAFQPFSESRAHCSGNMSYDISRLTCSLCPVNSIPNSNGIGCQCVVGWRVIQDVGYYRRSGGRAHGDSLDRNGDSGLKCEKCPDNSNGEMKVTRDGRYCIGKPLVNGSVSERCPSNNIEVERSEDGNLLSDIKCVECSSGTQPSPDKSICVQCKVNPILRKYAGEQKIENIDQCGSGSRCLSGPKGVVGVIEKGICIPTNPEIETNYQPSQLGRIQFENLRGARGQFESKFFIEWLTPAIYMCKSYRNDTACQMVGNICALTLHDKNHPSCQTILKNERNNGRPKLFWRDYTLENKKNAIPNVYHINHRSAKPTNDGGTSKKVDLKSRLNITVAAYDLKGKLLYVNEAISGNAFQMCNGSFIEFDAAFNFGTRYAKKCLIPAQRFFDNLVPLSERTMTFYDLSIPFYDDQNNDKNLHFSSNTGHHGDSLHKIKRYAMPMIIKNSDSNKKDNKEYTTRFFLVDSISGVSSSTSTSFNEQQNEESAETIGQGLHTKSSKNIIPQKEIEYPTIIRYLKRMEIKVLALNPRQYPESAGRIYPPWAVIEYGEITQEQLKNGAEVEFEFKVDYSMEAFNTEKDIEIAIGVMSAFAVIWAAMKTWSWSRRSGKLAIDPYTIGILLVQACGSLAHVFLAVAFFTSLYFFAFFKQQTFLHVLLPSEEDQAKILKHYVIATFCLKCVHIMYLIGSQMSVDVFLIDWERPKPNSSTGPPTTRKSSSASSPRESGTPRNQNNREMSTVSVWRTYLVANEWNELQTTRKINLSLQVVMVILVLRVCGVEHLATADPLNSFSLEDGQYHSDPSYVCRFALGVAVYAGISLIQVVFWCGLYTAVIEDKLQQFCDVCSLANISVFAMAYNNFGYYIHGKSAHGFSDTDMSTLLEQLQRESDDLCGHRGLTPGSDHQTFSMTLPPRLRDYYDKVVTPASGGTSGGGVGLGTGQLLAGQLGTATGSSRTHSRLTGGAIQHMVQAYSTMNRFLARFLEHALRDLDFEIRDKLFVESVFDIEFQDPSITDKAVFYTDTGHSFDALLLYGHEFSLTIFDVLMFSFVDLLVQDYLVAAIVTYFVGKILIWARSIGGRRNLARKTLIDKRFLI